MCGAGGRLEGWMGGSWQRVAGNHGGPRGEEGGRGWIGGSSGEPDLTNELIAGGAHSPTSLLIRICKERKSVGKIFLDFVRNVGVGGKYLLSLTCPHLTPLSCPTFHRLTPL